MKFETEDDKLEWLREQRKLANEGRQRKYKPEIQQTLSPSDWAPWRLEKYEAVVAEIIEQSAAQKATKSVRSR
jgi:hypothetical protein